VERGPAARRRRGPARRRSRARITVIAQDGRVVGESSQPSSALENHGDRPEFREALAHGWGHGIPPSSTLHERLLYVAWRQQEAVRCAWCAVPRCR
jgi:hypothetical protein